MIDHRVFNIALDHILDELDIYLSSLSRGRTSEDARRINQSQLALIEAVDFNLQNILAEALGVAFPIGFAINTSLAFSNACTWILLSISLRVRAQALVVCRRFSDPSQLTPGMTEILTLFNASLQQAI